MKLNNEDRPTNIFTNALFWIFMSVMILLIIVVGQSKFTGEVPSLFGNKFFIVESGSMEPAIKMSSLIIVKEVSPDDIKIGDVITFAFEEESSRVTHRVVSIKGKNEAFITKGDVNNIEDMSPVKREMVIGRVSFSIPVLGYILKFLGSVPGIAFMVLSTIAGGIIPWFFRREPKRA